jgi:hypothetical protein
MHRFCKPRQACVLATFASGALWCSSAIPQSVDLAPADVPIAFEKHVQKLKTDFTLEHPEKPDDIDWVKARIALLANIDQYGRTVLFPAIGASIRHSLNGVVLPEEIQLNQRLAALATGMDTENTAELKRLMARWGWFSSARFGVQTEQSAWLIVQHADQDPQFQREVLGILEPLVQRGEVSGKTYAYLYDRVATSFKDPSRARPQRYGTQGHCVGTGAWEPFPVEDPEHLDERRKSVALPPEAEYIALFKERCPQADPLRVPATETPAPPAQPAPK